jgi:DNA-binding NarL/FixJ family response regulator
MAAIGIFSADPVLRGNLERLLREDPTVTIVGVTDDPAIVLRLIDQNLVNAILADTPSSEQLAAWRTRGDQPTFVVLVDGTDEEQTLDVLYAGAGAILPRSAERSEIVVAIMAVTNGFVILPRGLLSTLLGGPSLGDQFDSNHAGHPPLTTRELEVLAAMADGASNKAIARQLGISFHTAKFHVAAILAKLNADSRTEAVTRAAQLGLVML